MLRARHMSLASHLEDLNPLCAGVQTKCFPGEVGLTPSSPFTMIHYVPSGRGTYHYNGKIYKIHAGQAFITPPTDMCCCIADADDPWTLRWVGFSGSLSSAFWEMPLVFDAEDDIFPHLKDLDDPSPSLSFELASDLMLLYTKLISPSVLKKNKEQNHVREIIDFIHKHYAADPTIQEIVDQVGLSRDYASRLFKEKTGRSIQSFLSDVRITNARRLLEQGLSVAQVAAACGFNSIPHFSRQFKCVEGVSPATWLKEMKMDLWNDYAITLSEQKEG